MSDSLVYEPGDLLGRIATIFAVVVTTGLDPVRQRAAWRMGIVLTALAIAANGSVLGFESTPAACIFAFGYPLLYAGLRKRAWRPAVLQAMLAPFVGLVLAGVLRVTQVALQPGPLVADLKAVRTEAETHFADATFARSFLGEWAHRIWVYWPILLIVASIAVIVAVIEVITRRRRPDILLYGHSFSSPSSRGSSWFANTARPTPTRCACSRIRSYFLPVGCSPGSRPRSSARRLHEWPSPSVSSPGFSSF